MRKVQLGLFGTLAFVLVAGCTGGRTQSFGKISGKVTYKGQPVKAGNVVFHSDSQGNFSGPLLIDGTYEVADVPPGAMTVTVENEFLNPDKKTPNYPGRMPGGQGGKAEKMDLERMKGEKANMTPGGFGPMSKEEMAARYVKIPAKYTDPKGTPLTVTISAGRQSHDFELTD